MCVCEAHNARVSGREMCVCRISDLNTLAPSHLSTCNGLTYDLHHMTSKLMCKFNVHQSSEQGEVERERGAEVF